MFAMYLILQISCMFWDIFCESLSEIKISQSIHLSNNYVTSIQF